MASPWYCENFCCLPARRFSDSSTRSATGRTSNSGSLAFSTSAFTMSRSPVPSNVLLCSAAARAALLVRLTRSNVASSSLCWSASGRSSASSIVAMTPSMVVTPTGSTVRVRSEPGYHPGRSAFSDRYYPGYAAVGRGRVGRARVRAAGEPARRRRAARGQARRVPRRARRVPRQAPAGAGGRGRAPDRQGRPRRLPPGPARDRDHGARRRRGDRRRRARVPVQRDPAPRPDGDAGARLHEGVRHPPRRSTGPTRCGGPSSPGRRSPTSSWACCAMCPGPRSKRAPAGSARVRYAG